MCKEIIVQCAPLIVGLKMAHTLVVHRHFLSELRHILAGTEIHIWVLCCRKEKVTLLLYNYNMFCSRLSDQRLIEFLQTNGYDKFGVEEVLSSFQNKYIEYCSGRQSFPHELGLFLGYPLEDVEGFIENEGENSLYHGYWKVYANVPAKRELFRMYELAKERMVKMLCDGVKLEEIIMIYCKN